MKGAILTEAGVTAGHADIFDSEEQMHQALNAAIEAENGSQESAHERNEPLAAAAV